MTKPWLVRSALIIPILVLCGCSSGGTPVVTPAMATTAKVAAATSGVKATIDLGVIIQGESAKLNMWVKNPGQDPVDVKSIESSCECLTVQLSKMQIPAKGRVLAKLHYDGSKEPDFIGSLQIDVQLKNGKGTSVGQIDVPIEVIRAESNEKPAP